MLSESEAEAEELNKSQSVGTSTVIGLPFCFCFRLRQSGFHLIVSDGIVSGVGRKWLRLRFRRAHDSAYDSDFWFSLGHKRSYDSAYDSDSDSDSVASENQPIAKNATTCLFVSHLGYAYGVGNKSTARSSVRSYFIGYFDAVNSDYFSQMSQILAKGLHFPVRPKM